MTKPPTNRLWTFDGERIIAKVGRKEENPFHKDNGPLLAAAPKMVNFLHEVAVNTQRPAFQNMNRDGLLNYLKTVGALAQALVEDAGYK